MSAKLTLKSILNALLPTLALVFWIWLDLIGVLLSTVSTYFYFGWEGQSNLVLKIFGIALFAFSGPFFYGLIFRRFDNKGYVVKSATFTLITLYLLLGWFRHSDFFALVSVLSAFLASLTLAALLNHIKAFLRPELFFFALNSGVLFYLSGRNSNGMALLFSLTESGKLGIWLAFFALSFAALALPLPQEDKQAETKVNWKGGLPGISLGLLTGLSVGLIYNFNIWSAKTPEILSTVYFLPFALGTLLAWLTFSKLGWQRSSTLIGSGALAAALYALLYLPKFSVPSALGIYTLGAFGLSFLWLRQSEHLLYFAHQGSYRLLASLQGGFVVLLGVLAVFLLHANPMGFWVALGLAVLCLTPLKLEQEYPPIWPGWQRLWVFWVVLLALPGTLFWFMPPPSKAEAPLDTQRIHVMSSNIRYGWTDDYRFEPKEQKQFIVGHPADIIGFQEVNKGHTSGAYMDLYHYYQRALPGNWRYGDANYGFGNALYSRYPIRKSETRVYQSVDMLRRSCQILTLEIQGKEVDVYNTHLSHLPPPNAVREAQLKELLGWLKESKNPWILMGDFNALPDSNEIQQVLPLAHPIFKEQPELLKEFSFSSLNPQIRIDYLFFSPDFKLIEQKILDNLGTSDHKPVYSILELP